MTSHEIVMQTVLLYSRSVRERAYASRDGCWLFHPPMSWPLYQRDRVLAEWRGKDPDGFAEDEALEITTVVPIDLDRPIAAIERAAPPDTDMLDTDMPSGTSR